MRLSEKEYLRRNPPGVLSVKEAAAICCQSDRTFRNWIKRGIIPHIRLGQRILIRRASLDAALAKLETPRRAKAAPATINREKS